MRGCTRSSADHALGKKSVNAHFVGATHDAVRRSSVGLRSLNLVSLLLIPAGAIAFAGVPGGAAGPAGREVDCKWLGLPLQTAMAAQA